MIRAIAKQAEAERVRRAKIIDAEGELQAADKFLKAGQIMAKAPQAMQLRYLTTLHTIGVDKNSTIVFPFPMELMQASVPEKKGKA
jgi:regulator of protease activity HflC (stomatin/prohibitin superfamily)